MKTAADTGSWMITGSAFGLVGVGFLGNRVGRLILPGRGRRDLKRSLQQWAKSNRETWDPRLAKNLADYFNGHRVTFEYEIDYGDLTPFIVQTLKELVKVEWGQTVTYAELAARVGRPGAARAVGLAMSRNPVPLIVPCHRVVRSDGGLGGFTTAMGVELKRRMLSLESLEVPTAGSAKAY